MSEYKLLINGELVSSSSGKTVDDIGPASGQPIAQVPESSVEDVNRAVAAAREAFDDGRWRIVHVQQHWKSWHHFWKRIQVSWLN